jgi:transcription factor MYB, plant
MRKKAQEMKRNTSPSSSSSSLTYQSGYPDTPRIVGTEGHGGRGCITSILKGAPPDMDGYPMDQIWMEIEAPEETTGFDGEKPQDHACSSSSLPGTLPPSAGAWDYYPDACWKMDDEIKMATQFWLQ